MTQSFYTPQILKVVHRQEIMKVLGYTLVCWFLGQQTFSVNMYSYPNKNHKKSIKHFRKGRKRKKFFQESDFLYLNIFFHLIPLTIICMTNWQCNRSINYFLLSYTFEMFAKKSLRNDLSIPYLCL